MGMTTIYRCDVCQGQITDESGRFPEGAIVIKEGYVLMEGATTAYKSLLRGEYCGINCLMEKING